MVVFWGGLERVLFYLFCGSEKSGSQTGLVSGNLNNECLSYCIYAFQYLESCFPSHPHPPQYPKAHLSPPPPPPHSTPYPMGCMLCSFCKDLS